MPFLLASRVGHFAMILYLINRKSILMTYNLSRIWSGSLIGWRRSYIVLALFTNDRQNKGHKGQM